MVKRVRNRERESRSHRKVERPRVAAIGLDASHIEAIRPLCGDLRSADSVGDYEHRYSWAETDLAVYGPSDQERGVADIPVLALGATRLVWSEQRHFGAISGAVQSLTNKERELSVDRECPEDYRTLAAELVRSLTSAAGPPQVIVTDGVPIECHSSLAIITSGYPVALRCVRTHAFRTVKNGESKAITLVLPEDVNLVAWFRAFLIDIREIDPDRVPRPPPRLGSPSDWFTPTERELDDQIKQSAAQVEAWEAERRKLEVELAAESEKAETGIRRAIWADGDDLESAVEEILSDLGFTVENMDAGVDQGDPKREDLRLTTASNPGWEAIVEVKGYTSGIKTNDAQQVRKHRDRYNSENRKPPDLTLWVVNPHRNDDPDSRPAPDGNAETSAALVGAVCVQTTDLYKLWMRVAHEEMPAADAAQRLIDAEPGLWSLPEPD